MSGVPEKYYVDGEARAQRVAELFAGIATRYDLINDIQSFGMHRWWKRRLVASAPADRGIRALDVCCGTGDITLALANRGFEAVGIDFSEPMLTVARHRGRTLSFSRPVRFVQGDALHLPFPDASQDVVTISYGLRNLADWQAGLRELLRVLRPAGTLLILEFGKPDLRLWRSVWFAYLRIALPIFGSLFAGNARAYAYIIDSLVHYPGQIRVRDRLLELGARDVQLTNYLGGMMSLHRAIR